MAYNPLYKYSSKFPSAGELERKGQKPLIPVKLNRTKKEWSELIKRAKLNAMRNIYFKDYEE